jgi:aspartate aminotransferase
MRVAFERRKNLVVKMAREIPGFVVNEPKGAFYLFPDCSAYFGKSYKETRINNPEDLALYLLAEAHVACVGGTDFGAPNCIRMSYANSDEQLVEAFKRMKDALEKLS